MTRTPRSDDDFAAQAGLARRQLRLARALHGEILAAAAAGRLAELDDLLAAQRAPVLSGGRV